MERTGLDWTLAFGGLIGMLLVVGTIILAFFNKDIPSVVTTGDLAVIGFFFTKGVSQVLTNAMPRRNGGSDPPATETTK